MSHSETGVNPRREFLKAGAALSASLLLGAHAHAQPAGTPGAPGSTPPSPPPEPPPPPKFTGEPIRMGVIGTGGMGTGHCHAFCDLTAAGREAAHIVALADPWKGNLENARKTCVEKQPGITVDAYADYRKLLDRKDIQGVLIASPEHWHHQHAIDAINAGKDVYTEKPMTLRLENALALLQAAKAHPDRIVQVGTQMMRLPKWHEARKLIQSGAIGTLTMAQTSYCRNSKTGEWNYYHVDPNWKEDVDVDWKMWCGPLGRIPFDPYVLNRWRRYRKTSTGIVGDLLVHEMTPLMFAMDAGWPVRVTAIGQHLVDKAMENHDTVSIVVEFENGTMLNVIGATNNELGYQQVIRGNKGNLFMNGRHCVLKPESKWVDEVEERTVECPDIGNDQDAHRVGWLSAIRSRTPVESSVELGTKVMVIVDLATRSMWEGGSWTFDPRTKAVARA